MTTPSTVPSDPSSAGTPAVPAARQFSWSLRRELWENRSIYLAPLAVAAVFLFGFLVSRIGLPRRMQALAALDPARRIQAIRMPFDIAAGLIMLTGAIVGLFYCLDALQGERRDRSILFWKSLPVSDLQTVLAKASIPIVFLQLITYVVTIATQLVMLLFTSAVLRANGLKVEALGTQLEFPRMSMLLLYHLFAVHALWYAPIYAWLILVSVWARRAPLLWAFLPPIALSALEKVVFGTSYLTRLLQNRLTAGMEAFTVAGTLPMDPMTHMTPGRFLASPGLWIGLAVAAAFLAAAARLRRYRGPI
jgi:ABC-2 type transport system permease protein